jgi:glycosyltransferase involved in cell wall biosynthesis
MSDPQVLLIANYTPDGQSSMQRFADLLAAELPAQGIGVDLVRPPAILGARGTVAAKWRGHADKLVLFPPRLRQMAYRRRGRIVVHVCDHSNALYVPWIADVPHVVTCHDLLAVRAAHGEFPQTQTRWSGRQLQRLVCRGLQRASRIVCDSEATRQDVRRIINPRRTPDLVSPGLSPAFSPVTPHGRAARLARILGDTRAAREPFILHVGGNQWYKNREGVLEIYAALRARLAEAPPLVLVGKPPDAALAESIGRGSMHGHVIAIANVADDDLAALYSSAALLLFPSFAEGFGWPVVEAMACGCRVVAAGMAPITDVAAHAATYIDPRNVAAAADIIAGVLREPIAERDAFVSAGVARASCFTSRATAAAYADIYRDLLGEKRGIA